MSVRHDPRRYVYEGPQRRVEDLEPGDQFVGGLGTLYTVRSVDRCPNGANVYVEPQHGRYLRFAEGSSVRMMHTCSRLNGFFLSRLWTHNFQGCEGD